MPSPIIPLVLFMLPAQRDGSTHGARAVRLARERIVVDGRLDEAVWSGASAVTGLRQREPDEGAPASDSTEVRVLYDGQALYIGIVAYSRQPSAIHAKILQRDRLMRTDVFGKPQFVLEDVVAVLLDPFHDHRNAVVFATNPNGAEFDALLTDEGREFNIEWRGVWSVRAARLASGWSAEIEIPFRTLRYPAGSGAGTWGFNVARMVPHNREETLWSAWSRDNEGFHRVSRAGHLEGLEGLPRSGRALDLKPFLLSSAQRKSSDVDRRLEGGLDAKWEVRPGLTLDLTANTDFAQVEVDSQQVNLTRFALFYPEKREFFLENAGIFEFGQRLALEPPPFLLFFSRRIGISDSGEVPMLGGVRLTGRVGQQTVGLLDVVTDDVVDQPRSNYLVARVKRDVGASSYVGAMVTDVRRGDGAANTAGGVDGSVWLGPLLNLQGFYAASAARGPGGQGRAYRLWADYQMDVWGVTGYVLGVSPEATADAGFITRTNTRRFEVYGHVVPRPQVLGLRKLDIYWDASLATRWDGGLQDRWHGPAIDFDWNSGDFITLYGLTGRTRLDEGFEVADSVPVPLGDYPLRQLGWFGTTARHRMVAFGSTGSVTWSYGGRVASAQGTLRLVPDRHLYLQLGLGRNWVRLPGGRFTADLASVRAGYAFSTQIAVNGLVQYNTLERSVQTNLRLNVIHRPGSDLFVVYSEERGSDASAWTPRLRRAVVKLTYLARL